MLKRGKDKKRNGVQSGPEEHSQILWDSDEQCGSDPGGVYTESEEEEIECGSEPQFAESKRIGWETIRYFSPSDFACRCDGLCDHSPRVNMQFVEKLDMLRAMLGLPIRINSGTRCKAYNERVIHSSPTSAHVPNGDGGSRAVDIYVPTPDYLHKLLGYVFEVRFSGIGIGKGYVHLEDTERKPSVWTYPPQRRNR